MAVEIICALACCAIFSATGYVLGYGAGMKWAVKMFKTILDQMVDDPQTEEEQPWSI